MDTQKKPSRGGARIGAGRPALCPGEKTVQVLIRFCESDVSRLDAIAREEGTNRSQVVREMLRNKRGGTRKGR